MAASQHDREIIRRLAGALAEVAAQPVQQERRELWRRTNDLDPVRPMLWITEIPWREFQDGVDELRLQCENKRLRNVEHRLRCTLFTATRLKTDEVVSPAFNVGKRIRGQGYGVEVAEDVIAQGDSYIQSHAYEGVIRDFDDIEKIKMPAIVHDEEATAADLAFFEDLLGDLLDVKVSGCRMNFFNAWDQLVRWTGVTQALMDLVARPDFIHACMRRMTDSMLSRITQLEEQGLLDASNELLRVGSGAAGFTGELPQPDADPDHIRTIDQWGGATPQIFSDVSPDMHDEFALAYENEVMSRCGLNYYGCCEPLHNKMPIMAKVPRLRKISISPWCDTAKAAANADRKYVFSHKPSPAILAEDRFNADRAEQDLRERIAQSGDMPCEIIMKDISTVRADVERVIAWCNTAWRVVNDAG